MLRTLPEASIGQALALGGRRGTVYAILQLLRRVGEGKDVDSGHAMQLIKALRRKQTTLGEQPLSAEQGDANFFLRTLVTALSSLTSPMPLSFAEAFAHHCQTDSRCSVCPQSAKEDAPARSAAAQQATRTPEASVLTLQLRAAKAKAKPQSIQQMLGDQHGIIEEYPPDFKCTRCGATNTEDAELVLRQLIPQPPAALTLILEFNRREWNGADGVMNNARVQCENEIKFLDGSYEFAGAILYTPSDANGQGGHYTTAGAWWRLAF